MAMQDDGKVIIAGDFLRVNGVTRNNIARLNANGSLDTTWNPAPDGVISEILVDGDALYVTGSFQNIGGQPISGLARLSLNDAGSADPSWPTTPNNTAGSLAADANSVFVEGESRHEAGRSYLQLQKISKVTGDTDGTWAPEISIAAADMYTTPYTQGLFSVGSHLYIYGEFDRVGTTPMSNLARVQTTGTGAEDSSWTPPMPHVALATAADNKAVYVDITDPNPPYDDHIGRIDITGTGTIDTTWITWTHGFVNELFLDGETLYVAGNYPVRIDLSSGGDVDSEWAAGVRSEFYANDPVRSFLVTPTSVFVGGSLRFSTFQRATSSESALAILDKATGSRNEDTRTDVHLPGEIHAFAEQPDGKILLGGQFGFAGNIRRQNILRLNADGTLDDQWAPGASNRVNAIAVAGNTVFIGGGFDEVGGLPRAGLAKFPNLNSDSLDTAWNPGIQLPNPYVELLAANGSAVFISHAPGSGQIDALKKISPQGTGEVDPIWNPNFALPSGHQFLHIDLELRGNALYLAGQQYDSTTFNTTYPLVKISPVGQGAIDSLWTPAFSWFGGPGEISQIESDSTFLYVRGFYDQSGATTGLNGLARIPLIGEGSIDPAFTPVLGVNSTSIAVARDWLYTTDSVGFPATHTIKRFSLTDASIDAGFTKTIDSRDPFAGGSNRDPLFPLGDDVFYGNYFMIGINGYPKTGIARIASASAPVAYRDAGSSRIILSPNSLDGVEITHFKVDSITGGQLFQADGTTHIEDGAFITREEGATGLVFTPESGPPPVQTFEVFAAVDNQPGFEGTDSSTVDLSTIDSVTVVTLESSTIETSEGASAIEVNVRKTGPGSGTISFSTEDLTANSQTILQTGDFQGIPPGTLTLFFSISDTTKSLQIPLLDDALYEGDEIFALALDSPTGSLNLASPFRTVATLIDDDIFGDAGPQLNVTMPSPASPPPSSGQLKFDLDFSPAPSGASPNAQWRLPGDFTWRDSGSTAVGLPDGNYLVEFKPLSGYFPPLDQIVTVASGQSIERNATYVEAGAQEPGSLSIFIEPPVIAEAFNDAEKGQWRRQGEAQWRDSGEVLGDLTAGPHIIEFKPVTPGAGLPGRITPAPITIQVSSAQTNVLTGTYLIADPQQGTPISPLAFSEATGSDPYRFCGQLHTDLGFSSGTVVKPHTILSVAHALFNDLTFSYVSNSRWFFQRYRDQFEPEGTIPRGWYVFDGYASQRLMDDSPGISTPASQELDVAAIFFLDSQKAGRGGASGYLVSNQTPGNEWLTLSRPKTFTGYAMDGVDPADRGKLFASSPADFNIAHSHDHVFSTSEVRGFPGASGGALFVGDVSTTFFYPAAVFLGGTGNTLFRAIDTRVVDLLNRAENSGEGGGNSTGGGVSYQAPGTTIEGETRGLLRARANFPFARWRLRDASVTGDGNTIGTLQRSGSTLPITGGTYQVEFEEIDGYQSPPIFIAEITPGILAIIDGEYYQNISSYNRMFFSELQLADTATTGPLTDFEGDGIVQLLEFAFNLNPTLNDVHFLAPGTGTSGLPSIMLQGSGSSARLCIEFIRRKASATPGIEYVCEFGNGLAQGNFHPSTLPETVVPIDDIWERVFIEDSETVGNSTNRYGRVRVVTVPPSP